MLSLLRNICKNWGKEQKTQCPGQSSNIEIRKHMFSFFSSVNIVKFLRVKKANDSRLQHNVYFTGEPTLCGSGPNLQRAS